MLTNRNYIQIDVIYFQNLVNWKQKKKKQIQTYSYTEILRFNNQGSETYTPYEAEK